MSLFIYKRGVNVSGGKSHSNIVETRRDEMENTAATAATAKRPQRDGAVASCISLMCYKLSVRQ